MSINLSSLNDAVCRAALALGFPGLLPSEHLLLPAYEKDLGDVTSTVAIALADALKIPREKAAKDLLARLERCEHGDFYLVDDFLWFRADDPSIWQMEPRSNGVKYYEISILCAPPVKSLPAVSHLRVLSLAALHALVAMEAGFRIRLAFDLNSPIVCEKRTDVFALFQAALSAEISKERLSVADFSHVESSERTFLWQSPLTFSSEDHTKHLKRVNHSKLISRCAERGWLISRSGTGPAIAVVAETVNRLRRLPLEKLLPYILYFCSSVPTADLDCDVPELDENDNLASAVKRAVERFSRFKDRAHSFRLGSELGREITLRSCFWPLELDHAAQKGEPFRLISQTSFYLRALRRFINVRERPSGNALSNGLSSSNDRGYIAPIKSIERNLSDILNLVC